MTEQIKKRKYLYEVDLLRIIFIFGVLVNHVSTQFNNAIPNNEVQSTFLYGSHLAFHFTRMGFMFVTGLVLFLNYYFKKFNIWTFWKKRFLGVLWTYLIWIALYVFLNQLINGRLSWPSYWSETLHVWQFGDQFYMYYILVVLQLYVIFPGLVWLFRTFNHHKIVGISFIFQLILLFLIKYVLPHIDTSHWIWWFRNYGFNIIVYQFYFIWGGYTAIHYDQVMAKLIKWRRLLGFATLILALGTVGLFFYNQNILHLSMSATEIIHQPYIFIYDIFIISWVVSLGLLYAQKRREGMLWKWVEPVVSLGAKIAFGIYLSQTLTLALLNGIIGLLPTKGWGLVALFPLGWILTVVLTFLLCWGFYKIPPFGLLIGRPQWHISQLWKKGKVARLRGRR